MKKKRMIPLILLKNGWLVQSKGFSRYQNLGNPTSAVKRFSQWASDELIYLDISQEEDYDLRRDDLGHPNRHTFLEIIEDVARETFMPLTVGGRVRSLSDIDQRLAVGADKVCINTMALTDPGFIERAAKEFGSQCLVISIDVKKQTDSYRVMSNGGKNPTSYAAMEWAKIAEEQGAGEILLNSIDRDGMKTGYDLELLNTVANNVGIPVIACGGVGQWEHFSEAFEKTNVDAVAAANIFHYTDQSVYIAKKFLVDRACNVRNAHLFAV